MFEDLIQKLDTAVRKIRGLARLTEANIADSLREVRRVLLEADVHFRVVKDFIAAVQEKAVGQEVLKSISPGQQVVKIIHDELVTLLGQSRIPLQFGHIPPSIIMVVGLQGSGKTTFSVKLAAHLKKQSRNPILVAGDIYRPAAIDQLVTLGKSVDVPVFHQEKEIPIDLVKMGISEARQKGYDTLILDTAGRLHVDDAMMQELEAIRKAVKPTEILYVADSMTGQDAVHSAKAFLERLDFTGIVLTKLDGDARGGAVLSIRSITNRPVKFVSSGEKLDQIEPFHPDRMASRILGMGDVVTLVEKAQESVDQEEAEALAHKLQKQSFTFEDFLDQLRQMKKMGPLSQVMGMLPGMSGKMNQLNVDDSALIKIEAMIQSMTVEERRKPQLINGSRRKRIATGSGTTIQDLNRLLKQFQMMQKMMKNMGRMRKGKMMRGLPPGFQF
jgi:signal recognition particle subunit SRP54